MIYGKPKDENEAFRRWKKMSSKSGTLHTGHCLMYKRISTDNLRENTFKGISKGVVSTKINFTELVDRERDVTRITSLRR